MKKLLMISSRVLCQCILSDLQGVAYNSSTAMRAPLAWPYRKVSILEVELLLPFSAWHFPGCKNIPILNPIKVGNS
jgi:hypothetical protein